MKSIKQESLSRKKRIDLGIVEKKNISGHPHKHEVGHLASQEKMSLLTSYYRWSLDYLGESQGRRIWDAGAGVGIASNILEQRSDYILATEIGRENLSVLKKKFSSCPKVEIRECDLLNARREELPRGMDTIVHLDVLEHIQEDAKVLRLFYDCLTVNGRLLVKVPAHPSLYCAIDRSSSHVRRYTREGLKRKLVDAGFEVSRITYMNVIGAVIYFVKGKILRHDREFANTINKNSFVVMNRIIPVYKRIERFLPLCFGLSVIAVAIKKGP